MRWLALVFCLLASTWAVPAALTIQVDLTTVAPGQVLRPQHELAFQLEGRPPGTEGAPGGAVAVYRITGSGAESLVDTLRCPPLPPDPPDSVRVTGYLYRQLFIWQDWRKAGAGSYVARYQDTPALEVRFQLP
jgi:hypothetical protein